MPEGPADPSGGVEGGGGVEAVRGCPSPPGPTTLSPRSRLYPAEADVEGAAGWAGLGRADRYSRSHSKFELTVTDRKKETEESEISATTAAYSKLYPASTAILFKGDALILVFEKIFVFLIHAGRLTPINFALNFLNLDGTHFHYHRSYHSYLSRFDIYVHRRHPFIGNRCRQTWRMHWLRISFFRPPQRNTAAYASPLGAGTLEETENLSAS